MATVQTAMISKDGGMSRAHMGADTALPAGVVASYAGTVAPAGWLFCDGSAVSRTTYADLFAAIGATFGAGDGTATFNLPDLRGRVIAGRDDMGGVAALRLTLAAGGLDGKILGGSGGADSHTLTVAQIPAHTHGQIASNATAGSSGNPMMSNSSGGGAPAGVTAANTGGGGSHPNVQPTFILNAIIKV